MNREKEMITTTNSITVSPVSVTGELDPNLSRWLWLVKMFLALPHFVVLVVLWAAFIPATFIALFAILFTGRYPRALWNFTTGVLRWHWRVGFYVFAALGTDTYPPFTLASTEYPAKLEMTYPEQLSRELVLAKWVLAIPHLVGVGLMFGVIMLYPWDANANWQAGGHPVGGYSVFNLLVVIAGFFLLATGRYPMPMFDLLMGINRWFFRVLVYVALMRDEYPPFRLDVGSHEPDDYDDDDVVDAVSALPKEAPADE